MSCPDYDAHAILEILLKYHSTADVDKKPFVCHLRRHNKIPQIEIQYDYNENVQHPKLVETAQAIM